MHALKEKHIKIYHSIIYIGIYLFGQRFIIKKLGAIPAINAMCHLNILENIDKMWEFVSFGQL